MSRCVSFWHKFEQEGNFCGMDPTEISRIKAYLEFVGKLEKVGFEKDFVYEKFTAGAARPIIALRDDETRTWALDYVAHCLKRGEKITESDLKGSIKERLNKAGKTCSLNARSEKLTNVNFADQPAPEIAKEPQSEKPDPEPPTAPIAPTLKERYNPTAPDAQPVAAAPSLRAPCLDGQPCPEGGYQVPPPKNSTLGIRCSVNSHSIKQLFKDECPLLVAAARKANPPPDEGFHTETLNGVKVLHELRPVTISKGPMEILWKPSPKMQGFVERVMKSQGLDTPAEALDEIVSRAMEVEA